MIKSLKVKFKKNNNKFLVIRKNVVLVIFIIMLLGKVIYSIFGWVDFLV